jgi:hypothetical protein
MDRLSKLLVILNFFSVALWAFGIAGFDEHSISLLLELEQTELLPLQHRNFGMAEASQSVEPLHD